MLPAGGPFPGFGQNRADTTLYTARSGAIVFDIVDMTRNLVAHVLAD